MPAPIDIVRAIGSLAEPRLPWATPHVVLLPDVPVPFDVSKVFDQDGSLVEPYRKAVAAAIPAGVEVSEAWWDALRIRIDLFLQIYDRRLRASLSRQRWERNLQRVSELGDEVRAIRRTTSHEHRDPLWPNRVLAGLWEFKVQCEAHVVYHRVKAGAFGGRRDLHREYLCHSVLDLWHELGQRVGYSTDTASHRGGLLPRFLKACTEPLVGELSDDTVRGIVRRWLNDRGF